VSEKFTQSPVNQTGESKVIRMTSAAEASVLMRRIATPLTVKSAINEIAEAVSAFMPKHMGPMSPSRAEDILRRERGVRVWPEELDAIRKAAAEKAKIDAEIRAEMAVAHARLARLEATLTGQDEEFFRTEIDAAREQMAVVERLLEKR
jgi:hypothetical protein